LLAAKISFHSPIGETPVIAIDVLFNRPWLKEVAIVHELLSKVRASVPGCPVP
jgi:hypothetical protein